MMKPRVSLEDIAKELNVSKNSVSRALRDCDDISDTLKEKVRLKADELGYIPNNMSQVFRGDYSKIIGIVTCDLLNPYYSINIDKLIKTLKKEGYIPITLLTESGYLDFSTLKTLLNYRVEAVISFQDLTLETYSYVKNHGFPIILYGLNSSFNDVCSVLSDDEMGGSLIAKEFLNSDRKKPCFVTWGDVETSRRRLKGFKETLEKNGKEFDVYQVGYAKTTKFVEGILKNENDFVFAYSDNLASDIVDYLKEFKYKNYDIYGFDGIASAISICKKIRSIVTPIEEMCEYATFLIEVAKVSKLSSQNSKMFPVKISSFH